MCETIDIVKLFQDHVDEVSDYECIDENILEDTLPAGYQVVWKCTLRENRANNSSAGIQ